MSADAVIAAGTFYPGDVDLTIEAIAQSIRDADETLPEFTEANVIVIDPEETAQKIDRAIQVAVARAKGLALLVVSDGAAENAEPELDTPRPRIGFELQLFIARARTRAAKDARGPLNLCGALAKHLHHRAIRVQAAPCFEEITFRGWSPIEDDTYHAWAISFDREMQL